MNLLTIKKLFKFLIFYNNIIIIIYYIYIYIYIYTYIYIKDGSIKLFRIVYGGKSPVAIHHLKTIEKAHDGSIFLFYIMLLLKQF